MDAYILIIGIGAVIVLSYFFDILSVKLRVPSVLFLIATGMILRYADHTFFDINLTEQLVPALEFLGLLGMILIVLEGAIELDLTRDKVPMIQRSLLISIVVLVVSSVSIAFLIMNVGQSNPFFPSLIYAIPLSVVSSAVLIPSIHTLTNRKKEFMTYEATFSDIMGILFFNFIVLQEGRIFSVGGIWMIIATILFSLVFSVALLWGAARIRAKLKLFLVFAILCILFAVGKKMHLSSLLMVFIFGIILNNAHKILRKTKRKVLDMPSLFKLKHDFKIITGESAFLLRTCFFVVFGMSINIPALFDLQVVIIGTIIILFLYLIRYINFKLFIKTDVVPEIFLAPRGLISILLFYQIPKHYEITNFSVEILSFVIIVSSIVMSLAIMFTPKIKLDNLTVIDIGLTPMEEEESKNGDNSPLDVYIDGSELDTDTEEQKREK